MGSLVVALAAASSLPPVLTLQEALRIFRERGFDLLIAQHRRARAVGKASEAKMNAGNGSKAAAFDRMKHKVVREEAVSQAKAEIATDDVEDRLAALEKEDRIEQLLSELKAKRGA